MIPPRFGIKLIPSDSYKRQFETIKNLIEQCDEIVNCGDAGQEGEPDTTVGDAESGLQEA